MVDDTSSSDASSSNAKGLSGVHGREYWDGVGLEWRNNGPDWLWREYTDRFQITLLDRWLKGPQGQPVSEPPKALKTDLFDEIAGRGIVRHLAGMGFHTTGIDISPVIVTEASGRNPELHAHCADARKMPFSDASFDLIYSGSTLDHFATVSDIAVAIKELVRVLRPSGKLVLTLDNPTNPLVSLRNGPFLRLLSRFGIVPYQVGVTLGPRRLANLLRSSGLEVLQTTAVLHCPRVLAVWRARGFEGKTTKKQERFLASLARWECLEQWPTRFVTGHFIAIYAIKK
ncbi:MAG: class I SAM-dependent methyltransferase [Pirellulaceae bacterium]